MGLENELNKPFSEIVEVKPGETFIRPDGLLYLVVGLQEKEEEVGLVALSPTSDFNVYTGEIADAIGFLNTLKAIPVSLFV